MNRYNYKSAIDNVQFSENLNEKILNHLSFNTLSLQNEIDAKKIRNKRLSIVFSTIACGFVLMIMLSKFNRNSSFELPNAIGKVSVKYTNKAPSISTEYKLVWLTEEEIFHEYNTDIFKGKIEEINNIKVDFNGSIEYRAIAKIRIDKIFRGNGAIGEIVTILLPCPIDESYWVEDTEVVSSMREGMTGIFMPIRYDETSFMEYNGAKIYWMDIVEYGFFDGVRYAFLDSENGVIFAKHAYESIVSANTMEEIEEYIMKMIE